VRSAGQESFQARGHRDAHRDSPNGRDRGASLRRSARSDSLPVFDGFFWAGETRRFVYGAKIAVGEARFRPSRYT